MTRGYELFSLEVGTEDPVRKVEVNFIHIGSNYSMQQSLSILRMLSKRSNLSNGGQLITPVALDPRKLLKSKLYHQRQI